jgi:hypothetical protein
MELELLLRFPIFNISIYKQNQSAYNAHTITHANKLNTTI